MELPAFIPGDLRQLARFVPVRGWDAIEWLPLMSTMRQLSWQLVSGRGVNKLSARLAQAVPTIEVGRSPRGAEALASVDDKRRLARAGDDLLRLYFAQWLLGEGMFLDLRAARLHLADERLCYVPSGLWIQLRDEFRQGMLALYRSFYSDDDSAFDQALRQMGMIRDGLGRAKEEQLKGMLNDHFGIQQQAQRFAIDDFKASFDQLFEFFIAHDYRLHSDFVFVGFYLITLYLTLEDGGQAHDVRAICSEVLL